MSLMGEEDEKQEHKSREMMRKYSYVLEELRNKNNIDVFRSFRR